MSELDAIDVFALPTHPAADVFPMLGDQELAELADDIRLNGLLNPLVIGALDGQPVLVDGRNRREACRIAGVTPQVISLNGTDPVAYVLSANIHRRHMSKGAMAMAVARLLETNTQTVSDAAKDAGLNRTRIAQARTVLRHAPTLVDLVIREEMGLDAAYKQALTTKQTADKELDRMARLKRKAADLADRVKQRELTYEEAETLFAEREREGRQKRDGIYQTFIKAIRAIDAVNGTGDLEDLPELLTDGDYYAEFRDQAGDVKALIAQAECLELAAQRLRTVVTALPKKPGVPR